QGPERLRSLVPGPWSLVPGLWSLVSGLWSLVSGQSLLWQRQNVARSEVDHDQAVERHAEQLENDIGRIARPGQRRAQRTVEIRLDRQRSAIEIVEAVHNLDRGVARRDVCRALHVARGAVGLRMERDALARRGVGIFALQAQVER